MNGIIHWICYSYVLQDFTCNVQNMQEGNEEVPLKKYPVVFSKSKISPHLRQKTCCDLIPGINFHVGFFGGGGVEVMEWATGLVTW